MPVIDDARLKLTTAQTILLRHLMAEKMRLLDALADEAHQLALPGPKGARWMRIDLERNAWAIVAAVRDEDHERLERLVAGTDHLLLIEELANWILCFLAQAKVYAMHAQLGWPVESTTLTRAEDVNSFVEMLMLSFAGQGEVNLPGKS